MELDTDMKVPDRQLRQELNSNFTKIASALNDLESVKGKLEKLQKVIGLSDDDLNEL